METVWRSVCSPGDKVEAITFVFVITLTVSSAIYQYIVMINVYVNTETCV